MGESKRRQEFERMVALATFAVAAFDEPADGEKRVAPTEFRLFHAGVNHTSKGDFIFDDAAAASVMAAYAARQTPLMGDYEHQSLAVPPMRAPASASQFVPAIRMDANGGPELWATQVQWTDIARTHLESGEYRMHSPAFIPDDDGRIKVLINFALTNLPASYGLEPLVAASESTPTKDKTMDEKELKALKDKAEELAARCEKMNALCLKRLGKSFDDWASEESEEHDAEEAKVLKALKATVVTVTGKADLVEATGALVTIGAQAKELVTLKAEQATAAVLQADKDFDALLTKGIADAKIPPAEKDALVALKADAGVAHAIKYLTGRLSGPALVATTTPEQPHPASAISPERAQIASISAGRFGGMVALKASLTGTAAAAK